MVTSDLTGKATTTDPVEDRSNTHVDLLDKDGNIIVRVRRTVMVMPRLHQQDLFPKVMFMLAIDNAEHPNISISKPVKATKLIVKSHKKKLKWPFKRE